MATGNTEAREAPLLDWRSEFQDSTLEALYRRTMLVQDAQQLLIVAFLGEYSGARDTAGAALIA